MKQYLQKHFTKVLGFGAAVLAAGVITTYVAVAAIPNEQGIIQACRVNNTGELRVIDQSTNQSCDSQTETAMQWQSSASGSSAPQAYANRVSIPYDTPGSQTLLTVPGYGTISAAPCDSGNSTNMNSYWHFTNTSGQTLEYYNPGNSSGMTELTSNSSLTEQTPYTVSIAPVGGAAGNIATLTVHSLDDAANSQCRYRVMATVTL